MRDDFFVPKGQEDSAQGFNPVLTLGKGLPLTTRPVRAQDRAWQQYKDIMYLEHGSIPRSGLGPHYFLHQKSKSTLQSTEVRSQAHAYLTGTLRALDGAPLEVGGVADHVHILCGLSRKISLSELVKNLKPSSSKILKGKVHDGFSWQNGYGAFSVSQSASKSVFSYIADQEIHHRRMTFR